MRMEAVKQTPAMLLRSPGKRGTRMTHKAAGHTRELDRRKKGAKMDPVQRTSDGDSKQDKSAESEDRRSRRRDEGALSSIEDITYSVLRKHKPKP